MLEGPVEDRLIRETKKIGCECWKFTSPGRRGVPDRVVICPGKLLEWAEAKRPGGKPEPLQSFVHGILAALGWKVWIIDTYEEVDEFIKYLKSKLYGS